MTEQGWIIGTSAATFLTWGLALSVGILVYLDNKKNTAKKKTSHKTHS